ncbi:hypothetical protein [Pseudomonas brassicacearum]|uniref:hypothetical protein n=1 Tax=Pseudomonas brassicacearum TaxID=930166 RepID=UPI0016086613|nr:hypothetical protein [Pseudomonas brassicacearum]
MSDRPTAHGAPRFPWNIDYTSRCDQCGKWRAQGSHLKCSRQRQRINAHLRHPPPKR